MLKIFRPHHNSIPQFEPSIHFGGIELLLTTFAAVAFILALLLLPVQSHASGSYSTGGGGANQVYHLGKKAFYQKLICTTCPLADLELNADQANNVVNRLNGDEEFTDALTGKDRKAIVAYLKRRYRL